MLKESNLLLLNFHILIFLYFRLEKLNAMLVNSLLVAEAAGNPKPEPQRAQRRQKQKEESLRLQQYWNAFVGQL